MTCHDARELFSALVDEALDAAERGALEAHLATCAECRRELERFRATVSLLHAVQPERAPVGFVDRALATARPTPWYRRLLSALFLPWPVKIPAEAAAIVLVSVGVVYLYRVTPELQQWDQIHPVQPPVELRRQTETPPTDALAQAQRAARTEAPPASAPSQAPPAAKSETPAPSAPPSVASEARPASPPRAATPEPAPASPQRRAREYMEKEGLKDDSSRDADVQAPRAKSRVEGKLEGTPPAASAPPLAATEPRADAQASKRQATSQTGAASFVPPDVSGRLAVTDRDAALRGLDQLLARLGAVIDRRLTGSEGPIIELSVTREAYAEFVRELARLGRWQPTREPAQLPEQIRVVLRITS